MIGIGKRVVVWVLAVALVVAVLANLCGCGKTNAKAEDEWFEDSAIINTEFRPEDLLTAKLSSNEDIYTAAQSWAVSFVALNYKEYNPFKISTDCRPEDNDALYFSDGETEFAVTSFNVEFQAKMIIENLPRGGRGYLFRLQTIMKVMETGCELVGYVTNQSRLITEPEELEKFLTNISAYQSIQISATKSRSPFETVNLTELAGGLKVVSSYLAGNTLYLFCCKNIFSFFDSNKEGGFIKAFSTDNFSLLYEHPLPIQYPGPVILSVKRNTITFSITDVITKNTDFYSSSSKTIKKLESVPDDKHRLSLTAAIRDSDGSLFLEKWGKTTPILTGSAQNPSVYYQFAYRLNNICFVFEKRVYEYDEIISRESGLYNIRTGVTTMFSHPNADFLSPIAAENDKVILVPERSAWYTSYGPFVFDTASGQTKDLKWFNTANSGYYDRKLSLFGDSLVSFSKDDGGFEVRILDLKTQTQPQIFYALSNSYAEPDTIFADKEYLWFFTKSYTSPDQAYLYRLER